MNRSSIFVLLSSLIISCGFFLPGSSSAVALPSALVNSQNGSKAKEANGLTDFIVNIKQRFSEENEEARAVIKEAESLNREIEYYKKRIELNKNELNILQEELNLLNQNQETADQQDIQEHQQKISKLKSSLEEDRARLADLQKQATIVTKRADVLKQKIKNEKENTTSLITERLENRSLLRKLIVSVFVLAFCFVVFLALRFLIRKFEKSITPNNAIRESERVLRLKTLSKMFQWLTGILVFIMGLYLILGNFGIDTTFLLTGAGIVGLAFGFGGQYLIRDLITGVFIIIEGQYRIDDVVKIGELAGLVEDINLRITTLRDLEGRVIIIPNGEVKSVINYTREFSYALFDLGVAYKENVDRVMDVIKKVGAEMREDEYFKYLIIEELEMLGVDDFADSQVTIKFRLKTLPIKQWEVAREFRRRIKNRFDELGIEIPFPHRTLYVGTGQDNEWLKNFAMSQKTGAVNN